MTLAVFARLVVLLGYLTVALLVCRAFEPPTPDDRLGPRDTE